MARTGKRAATLRRSFIEHLPSMVRDLIAALEDDEELGREFAREELVRLSERAVALQFDGLSVAADAAAEAMETRGILGLQDLVSVARDVVGRRLFDPVVVVAGEAAAGRLAGELRRFSEPVQVVASVAEVLVDLSLFHLQAVVLPAKSIGLASRVAELRKCPVYVYGPNRDLQARLAAVEAGAAAYLAEPVDLQLLMDLVRLNVPDIISDKPTAFLLAPKKVAHPLAKALHEHNVTVMASASDSDLIPALDDLYPDAIVMNAHVGTHDASDLVAVLRTHGRFRSLPVFVVGDIRDPEICLKAGADDVLPGDAWPETAMRIHARVSRMREAPRDRVPLTALLNRAGAMRLVDKVLSGARRNEDRVAVGILRLLNPEALRSDHGDPAWFAAMRLLARTLAMGLRTSDLVGHLNHHTLVVVLDSCDLDNAHKRLTVVRERFEKRCSVDRRLVDASFEWGLADGQDGLDDVLYRAEVALVAGASK
jgi:GGDEF domain-containing protein